MHGCTFMHRCTNAPLRPPTCLGIGQVGLAKSRRYKLPCTEPSLTQGPSGVSGIAVLSTPPSAPYALGDVVHPAPSVLWCSRYPCVSCVFYAPCILYLCAPAPDKITITAVASSHAAHQPCKGLGLDLLHLASSRISTPPLSTLLENRESVVAAVTVRF